MRDWTSEQIKALRVTHNLYQRELADFLGVTRRYVIDLEKGVKEPSKTLRKLLDCTEEKLKRKEARKSGKVQRSL